MESFALHVLVVAGSPQKRRALRRLLAQGRPNAYTISYTDRADLALSYCRADPPDCVLLSVPLPDQDAQRFLADLRATSDVPVVLLTDVGHEAMAVDALQHGAQDYLLTASLTPLRLRLTIQRAVAGVCRTRERDHTAEVDTQLQARTALVLSEQRLRLALDAGGLVIWEWDISVGMITLSGATRAVLGLPPDRLYTLDELAQLVYPPDLPVYEQVVAAVSRDGGIYQVRLRILTDDQHLVWVDLHGLAQHGARGQLVRAFGIARDISAEQQRAAAQTLHLAISQALSPARDVAATLQTLVGLPLPTLADYCAIYLRDASGLLRPAAAAVGDPAQPIAQAQVPSAPGLLSSLLEGGGSRLLTTVPPELAPTHGPLALHTALLVPLTTQDSTLGVLVLGRAAPEHRYDAADLALAEALARRGAESLTRAELQESTWAAQQAAAEVYARLEALVTSLPSGVGYLDHELRYQLVNPALAALNGQTPEEHLGRTLAEMLPPDMSAAVEPLLHQVLATGMPVRDLEVPGQASIAESTPRDWLISFFPVPAPSRGVAGVGVTVTDVTASKRTVAALRDTRRKLGILFELLPVGVSIFDAVGSLVYVNPALEQILRMDRANLLQGMHLTRPYFRPDGTPRPLDELVRYRVFREHQAIVNQVNGFLSEAGEEVWTYVSGVPVDFPDWRAVLITADITAQRQAQGALGAHAEALSRTNAELTRALQLKDEFLAMMSHELRTPLSVVLGVTEALEEELYGPISDQQRQALGNVAQSARQLLAILSDILDLAHLEVGKADLNVGAVDVDLLCQIALQFVQAAAQAKHIQLLCTVDAGIEGLRADERRLTQILTNLLDNAVKFTPQGGTVGLEVTADASEERIQFVVWDTGIGIAETGFARLFQPFTQLDGRLSREYGGVGLGLTLVRRLVDMHGGSVSLESTPGQGSRFTVRLPWAPGENVVLTMIRGPAPPPRAWAHPPTLVIADDHELTLQFYAELLRKQGCEVALARTGAEAVAQVRAARPEVAVLDIQMPEIDGLSAIRQIRADPEVGATPIIALTALAMPGDRERCLAAGASAYLAKPIGTRALVAAIAEALSGSQTGE